MKKINLHFHNLGQNPPSDWGIALLCFVAILFFIAAFDIALYKSLGRGEVSPTSSVDSSSQILDRAEIDKTVKAVSDRDLDATIFPESVLRDPSL